MTPLGMLRLFALLAAAPSTAAFGPFASDSAPVTKDAAYLATTPARARPKDNPLYLAFDVYRYTMTVFDGPRCVHRPVCSVYGVRAVERHGLLGFFFAIDRLWRGPETSSLRGMPVVWIKGEPYFEDPLSNSDFWLRPKAVHPGKAPP